MKPQNRKLLFTVTTGTLVLGIAGAGGFLVYNALKKPSIPFINYTFSSEDTLDGGLQIQMAPTNQDGKKDLFFLSNEGKTKFASAIKHNLNYGPEFYDVPNIYIDNENGISSSENGNYLPSGDLQKGMAADSINLSSKAFREYGLSPVKLDTTNDPNQNLKIELLMQILFHEYGHFQANKYIQSETRTAYQETFNVFMDTTSGHTVAKTVTWDKAFIDQFQKDLHYDNLKDTGTGPVFREPLLDPNDKRSDGTYSIGSLYSANELFWRSNHTDQTKNGVGHIFDDKLKAYDPVSNPRYYTMGGKNTPIAIDAKNAYNYSANIEENNKNLSYLYSSDEVFTRKYQQILMPYHEVNNGNGSVLSWNGVVSGPKIQNRISPFQVDTLNYVDRPLSYGKFGKYPNKGYNGIDPKETAGVYMADNPIAAKNDLYDIYAQQVGYKDNGHSDEISVIYYDSQNQLRIGGYLPTDVTKDDVVEIGNGSNKFKTETYEARFRLMKDFKGSTPMAWEKGLSKRFWVSKPLSKENVKSILGKPLSFSITSKVETVSKLAGVRSTFKDTTKEKQLEFMKPKNIGVVTTWRADHTMHPVNPEYYIINDADGIKIVSGDGSSWV